jgi:hypothetical protein
MPLWRTKLHRLDMCGVGYLLNKAGDHIMAEYAPKELSGLESQSPKKALYKCVQGFFCAQLQVQNL